MSGDREDSVLFATRYKAIDETPADPSADEFWQHVISVRNEVSKQIEELRKAGEIGSSLDAAVNLYVGPLLLDVLDSLENELRFVLITSAVKISALDQAPESAFQSEIKELKLSVEASSDQKCVRCWHRQPEVGSIEQHPELCARCVENIEDSGELRLHA